MPDDVPPGGGRGGDGAPTVYARRAGVIPRTVTLPSQSEPETALLRALAAGDLTRTTAKASDETRGMAWGPEEIAAHTPGAQRKAGSAGPARGAAATAR